MFRLLYVDNGTPRGSDCPRMLSRGKVGKSEEYDIGAIFPRCRDAVEDPRTPSIMADKMDVNTGHIRIWVW